METVPVRELSFSSWCSSNAASRCNSESSVGPAEDLDQAFTSCSAPRGTLLELALRSQPIILLRRARSSRRDHKHRKRPEPPPTALHGCGDLACTERLAPPKKRVLLAGIGALLAW